MALDLTTLADRFVQIYGQNGSLCRRNVSRFLSNLHMDKKFILGLKFQGECQKRNFSSSLWYDPGNLTDLVLALWDTAQTPACHSEGRVSAIEPEETVQVPGVSPAEVWGYCLLCVTLINLCAVLGVIFMPFMGHKVYKLLMTFMTTLAVGSLLATALLILLPDSLQLGFIHEDLSSPDSVFKRFNLAGKRSAGWEQFLSDHPWYIWRSCSCFGGIYLFFILERALKELLGWRSAQRSRHQHSHGAANDPDNEATPGGSFVLADSKTKPLNESDNEGEAANENGVKDKEQSEQQLSKSLGSLRSRLARVQPVAWMILMGDALHNFIDGLSLGAGFSRSTLTGVSISLAVLCEELPHELGDFAILLSAGMSVKMALVTNLISAAVCYAGFALGVVLGEVAGSSVWIFGFGAGMFMYISMVDMMPEVNEALDGPESKTVGKWKIFMVQNIGFLAGYGVIMVIALFGGDIKIG